MKLGTILTAAVLAAITTTPTFADQLDDIKERGSLKCGVLSIANPFGFQDPKTRELVGYDVDFCKGVAGKMGVNAELIPLSVEARIPELKLGKIDVLAAALGYNEERAAQIDYSNRYFVSRQIVIVRQDTDIDALSDLDGLRIASNKGSSNVDYLRQLVPGAEVLTYQDSAAAFLAFVQEKVDGYALSELGTLQLREKGAVDFVIVPEPLKVEPWGLGVKKDEPALLAAVNAAMDEMEASGEAQAIFDNWFGPETAYNLKRGFTVAPIAD
jgi:polar amino acid transport system substrate-binding protein